MASERTGSGIFLITNITYVKFSGGFSLVTFYVVAEICTVGERFSTFFTSVRPFTCVQPDVYREVLLC